MHVLVIGGAGFIGSHTVDCLLERGHTVRVLDALVPQVHGTAPQRPAYLDPRAELVVGHVEDTDVITRSLEDVESVIHLAAAVGVGQSMYQVTQYCTANTMGTAVLLQTLIDRKTHLHSLVVASSMSVYGEGLYHTVAGQRMAPTLRTDAQMAAGSWEVHDSHGMPLEAVPTTEDKPLQPTSIYAINKRDQEEMCLCIGAAYNIPTVALRFFNTYGSRQALSNPYTGVAAIFCARLLNDRPPLVFEDGKQQRDFVHVHDVARAVVAAAERPVAGEVMNIGSGEALSVLTIAEILALELGKDIAPQIVGKYRRGDIRHCFADISKARRLLQWEPQRAFRQGVAELVAWVRAQHDARDSVHSAWDELQRQGLLI